MKGVNKIILNSGTLVEALQEYFDRRSVDSMFKVTNVECIHEITHERFNVTVASHESKQPQ